MRSRVRSASRFRSSGAGCLRMVIRLAQSNKRLTKSGRQVILGFMTEVLIVGGGIGGLCLAHGLRRAGIPVTVFERTTERTEWLQGYRIHINPHGSSALHACLPPENWQQFVDTVSKEDGGGFAFVTEQGKTLLEFGPEAI